MNVNTHTPPRARQVNSRKVMGSILKAKGISDAQFAPVCVVVDKLDKIGPDAVKAPLLLLLLLVSLLLLLERNEIEKKFSPIKNDLFLGCV